MGEPSAPNQIPQSMALTEASAESLDQLLSRDPFLYSRLDRDKVVAELRLNRERFAKAEAEVASGVRKTVASKPKKADLAVTVSDANVEDLGL